MPNSPWLLMAPVIFLNVLANIALKWGASTPVSPWLLGLMSWRSLLGLFLFGIGGIVYAYALRHVPLSIAQCMVTMQYIFAILAAMLLFGESVSMLQAFGMCCIAIGLICVTL